MCKDIRFLNAKTIFFENFLLIVVFFTFRVPIHGHLGTIALIRNSSISQFRKPCKQVFPFLISFDNLMIQLHLRTVQLNSKHQFGVFATLLVTDLNGSDCPL